LCVKGIPDFLMLNLVVKTEFYKVNNLSQAQRLKFKFRFF